jgi:hypothetical protein
MEAAPVDGVTVANSATADSAGLAAAEMRLGARVGKAAKFAFAPRVATNNSV